jgi:hypothetical protein
MNIDSRLADIERLLAEVYSDLHQRAAAGAARRAASEGRQLVDDLDHAQIMKAASYLGPSRHAAS